jgi:hypothetical protein
MAVTRNVTVFEPVEISYTLKNAAGVVVPRGTAGITTQALFGTTLIQGQDYNFRDLNADDPGVKHGIILTILKQGGGEINVDLKSGIAWNGALLNAVGDTQKIVATGNANFQQPHIGV